MFDAGESDDTTPVATVTPEDAASLIVREHLRRGGGRGRLPDHLPREIVDHDLAEGEKSCPCCGETRQRIGSEMSEQLEFVPAVLNVIEHRRWKYACRRCEEQVVIAPIPNKPIAKGLLGPGLLSSVVVSKYADHLPLYRLEDVFARSGVELSRSTLCRWAMRAAAMLEPVYQMMVERVCSSESIHTDDTPVPVLDASLPKTRTARFWVYCGDWRNPFTVYDYTTSRKRDGPVEFLKTFEVACNHCRNAVSNGSWANQWRIAEKLISDEYSGFCLKRIQVSRVNVDLVSLACHGHELRIRINSYPHANRTSGATFSIFLGPRSRYDLTGRML
jgi:transposase